MWGSNLQLNDFHAASGLHMRMLGECSLWSQSNTLCTTTLLLQRCSCGQHCMHPNKVGGTGAAA